MDFHTLFPNAATWVEGLPKAFPFVYLQDIYAPFGALHLVGLALLGGCVILLNLRLMGAGLTTETPSVVEKNLRPWLITGAAIVLCTGIIIGCLNSSKLYYSPAFFVKMVSMLAALIFTFGVSNSVAQKDGKVGFLALIAGAAALLIWLFALGVFSTTAGVNPGTFHIIWAGYAILLIFGRKTRMIALIALLLLLGGVVEQYIVHGLDSDDVGLLNLSKLRMIISGLLLVGLFGYEIYEGKAEPATPLAKVIALFSILSWVTVAAGGRWIGFS